MVTRLNVFKAGQLIDEAYEGKLGSKVAHKVDVAGVQAFYLKDGTLVIPGTNEKSDWSNFNFNVGKGEAGRTWHAGFLKHAMAVYPFGKGAGAKRVIGHSLGAASAQIVAASLGIPAICFASPRPLRGRSRVKGEHRILKVCRADDPVGSLPLPLLGFRQVGKTCWLRPSDPNEPGGHNLKSYLKIMKSGKSKPDLPDDWG